MSESTSISASDTSGFRANIWLRNLPYGIVLILTSLGVAYTSFSKHPIVAYWEFLVPVIGVVCVGAGWRHAHDRQARLRLNWTQTLHWLAFLIAMKPPRACRSRDGSQAAELSVSNMF
jgi:hypothetical protein